MNFNMNEFFSIRAIQSLDFLDFSKTSKIYGFFCYRIFFQMKVNFRKPQRKFQLTVPFVPFSTLGVLECFCTSNFKGY